jgi:hypothetical protein
MKKITVHKPIGVIIQIYKKTHFVSNKLKCHVCLFIFSLSSSTKLNNRRMEHVLPGGEDWHQWEGGGDGERCRRVNMVQKMSTHLHKCKNDIC